ncbi:MAG: hypothetical protein COA38_01065 [Fluviicola sp.]|nr:MAG: hypothetical protein COA38_01065 [Fluviicola sp.]
MKSEDELKGVNMRSSTKRTRRAHRTYRLLRSPKVENEAALAFFGSTFFMRSKKGGRIKILSGRSSSNYTHFIHEKNDLIKPNTPLRPSRILW